jgi:hypothetical protein
MDRCAAAAFQQESFLMSAARSALLWGMLSIRIFPKGDLEQHCPVK